MNIQKLQDDMRELSAKHFPNQKASNDTEDDYAEDLLELLNKSKLSGFTVKDIFTKAVAKLEERKLVIGGMKNG